MLDKYPDWVYNNDKNYTLTGYLKGEKPLTEDIINKENCCCRYKTTPRSEDLTKNLQTRLNRVIGQLGGIKKMIDDNRYCSDILTQIAAAESALQSVGFIILKEHMETCVADEIGKGNKAIIDETVEIMKKLK